MAMMPLDRHKDEGLELEVDGHDVQGGVALGEAGKDGVHPNVHDGTDRGHDGARESDGKNALQVSFMDHEFTDGQAELLVFHLVQQETDAGGNKLADDRGDGGAGNAHTRESKVTEDQDGIQEDIRHGAAELRDHGEDGISRGLEHAFKVDRRKQAEAEDGDNKEVIRTHGEDAFPVGQVRRSDQAHDRPGKEEAEEKEEHASEKLDQQAVPGGAAGSRTIPFAQAPADQAVDSCTHAGGKGDHQHLERGREGNGGEAVRVKAGDEDAVHHVIKGLDHHGEHDGDGDPGHQEAHGHRAEQTRPILRLHVEFLPLRSKNPNQITLSSEPLSVNIPGRRKTIIKFLLQSRK